VPNVNVLDFVGDFFLEVSFWLPSVLHATPPCNFSSLIPPDGSAPLQRDPPEPQNIGQTQCFATFLPFRAPASSFFWLFLFSDSSNLCVSICPYCRKFHF
jgi:hypothetical protein